MKQWKAEKKKENESKDLMTQLDQLKENIQVENIEDKEKINVLLEQIIQLREKVQDGSADAATINSEVKKVNENIDETIISESVRRETVKAIIKQLKSQEFLVSSPELVENADGNYVKVMAKKPSGKRAECRVDLHGKIKYKFDSYEGMTCLKDIEKFNVDLRDIYSIQLSDERILWQNPNKISKDEKPMGYDQRRRG